MIPITVLVIAGLASAGFVGYRALAKEPPASWPAFTMYYSLTGVSAFVGDTPVSTTTQYSLTYNSPDNWREDVTGSTPVHTRWGSFGRTGEYVQVMGNTVTSYETMGGETTAEEIPDGEMHVPASLFYPISFEDLEDIYFGQQAVRINTGVRVCYNNQCQDNAPGWKFTKGSREWVYADDVRGIPLQVGPAAVSEVRITGRAAGGC